MRQYFFEKSVASCGGIGSAVPTINIFKEGASVWLISKAVEELGDGVCVSGWTRETGKSKRVDDVLMGGA